MQDVRVRITIVVVAILVLLGGGVSLLTARRPTPPPILITQPALGSTSPVTASPSLPASSPAPSPPPAPAPKYYVHVAGAVKNPSLYLLPAGSRVMQAIKAAGGPTAQADLDSVNLAEKVRDGEKVYIPVKAAVTQTAMLAPPGNTLGHESVDPASPAPQEAASTTPAAAPAKVTKAATGSSTGKAAKLSSPSQGQVNINTATADQLQRLPGIGPAMAARILAYRRQAGGFQKIEELQEISGIGPKKYAKIAPLVKLQ